MEFDDGDEAELNVNLIAEAMYAQCNPVGNQNVLLDSLVDHRCLDMAIQPADQKVVRHDGRAYMKWNTIGWQIFCQWKDGSTSWENHSDLKASHPLETAEYAVIIGIDHEPAFNWWVKRIHKFGIEVPKTVKEALDLDPKNGNTRWADAIAKEMKEVRIAFNILPDGHVAPNGNQKIPCHMIFDVMMEDFRCKARLVAGGHRTKAPGP